MRFFPYQFLIVTVVMFGFIQTSSGQLQSSTTIGGLAGAPMRMGFGARGIAMGNALTAVLSGDVQAYYNPSIIPFETAPTATIAYGVLSLDRKLNFLSFSQSLKPNAGMSFALINAGVSDIDGRNYDGVHTDTYSTSEDAFLFSFGLKPINCLSVGLTLKILYYSLFQNVKSTTAAIDIGAIFRLSDEITIGAVIQDINAKYRWDTSNLYGSQLGNSYLDNYPLRKRIGLSWSSLNHPLIISTEFEAIGSDLYSRVGAEVGVYDEIFMRAGLDQIALKHNIPAKPSIGMELRTSMSWSPTFQYTYVFEPYSPSGIHILSLSLRFK